MLEQDGRMSARYHYDEFGIPQSSKKFDVNWPGPDQLFGYTGLGYDYYSGLTYARARYYQPELGRFVSEDPYKGDIWNPQSQNQYVYVQNNPLIYVDPSGYISWGTAWHLTRGMGASLGETLSDVWSMSPANYKFWTETLTALHEFNMALAKGEITLDDIRQGMGDGLKEEYVEPFEHIIDNFDNVFKGDPTKDEAYDYGYYSGKAIQTLLTVGTGGTALAVKLASKVPKFAKLLTKISGNGVSRDIIINSATQAKKGGETVAGHALQKHAGRNPDI